MIKKTAFTLAEVLITLGIIGVVAALTIPTLLQKTFEREMVSKLKKNYAIVANAVEKWQLEQNCVGDSASCSSIQAAPHNAEAVAKELAPYLNITSSLYSSNSAVSPALSWIPIESYALNGLNKTGTLGGGTNEWPMLNYPGGIAWSSNFFLLADGTVIKICGIWNHYDIIFDLNGVKKPNRMGKDQFVTSLYTPNHKSYNPYLSYTYNANTIIEGTCDDMFAICNADDGHSPTAYVLKYDKLPDLTKLGYPASP